MLYKGCKNNTLKTTINSIFLFHNIIAPKDYRINVNIVQLRYVYILIKNYIKYETVIILLTFYFVFEK